MHRRLALRIGVVTVVCAAALCAGSGAATTVAPPPAGQAALAVGVGVQHGAVALVGAGGTGVKVLAVGTGTGQLVSPAWSPDGHRLAYTLTQPAANGRAASSTIEIVRLPGASPRALTATRPGRLDDDAAFSPLGTRVAFARSSTVAHNGAQIMVAPASFGAPAALTSGRSGGHTANDADPAWSPGGGRIAFTRTIGASSSIWIMHSNGADQHRLVADAQEPAWSPDGDRLAFVSARAGNGHCGRHVCAELYVSLANGALPKRLTSTALDESDPAWSPDGSLIAYARGGGAHRIASSVYTIDPSTPCPFRVTGTAAVSAPAWRPGLAPPAAPPACP